MLLGPSNEHSFLGRGLDGRRKYDVDVRNSDESLGKGDTGGPCPATTAQLHIDLAVGLSGRLIASTVGPWRQALGPRWGIVSSVLTWGAYIVAPLFILMLESICKNIATISRLSPVVLPKMHHLLAPRGARFGNNGGTFLLSPFQHRKRLHRRWKSSTIGPHHPCRYESQVSYLLDRVSHELQCRNDPRMLHEIPISQFRELYQEAMATFTNDEKAPIMCTPRFYDTQVSTWRALNNKTNTLRREDSLKNCVLEPFLYFSRTCDSSLGRS